MYYKSMSSYEFKQTSEPTRPGPVMTIHNPDFTGITDNIATVWAGDIRVGRVSFRRLSGTEIRRVGGRDKVYDIIDFYYVGTLLMDTGSGFDVDDDTPESNPIAIHKSLDKVVAVLEDIAERIEL